MIHTEYFTFNAFQERCTVIWDESGSCAFVDPGCSNKAECDSVTAFVTTKGLKPECIMLTHAHLDHIYGMDYLAHEYGIPVYIHKDEIFTIEQTNPYVCGAFGLPLPDTAMITSLSSPEESDGARVVFIGEGDKIKVGSLDFEVIETPGHTTGGVCYLERTEKVLFSGDTIFAGAIGRTDHPGGDYDMLMKSIFEKLLHLEGETAVIPGHGPLTDISTERMTNPFFLPFNEPYEE